MLSFISNKLRTLHGLAGYVEVDHHLNLVENTTLTGDEKAVAITEQFINLMNAYKAAAREVKTISIACGNSVYVGISIPTGYLIVQMSRKQQLVGVRRALAAIIQETTSQSASPPAVQIPTAVVQRQEKNVQLPPLPEVVAEPVIQEISVWPDFKNDLLKVLSQIAPENILLRLFANAFKKTDLDSAANPANADIPRLASAVLDEIPNAARRKMVEADVLKILAKYNLR
jgi:hypothetical protein